MNLTEIEIKMYIEYIVKPSMGFRKSEEPKVKKQLLDEK